MGVPLYFLKQPCDHWWKSSEFTQSPRIEAESPLVMAIPDTMPWVAAGATREELLAEDEKCAPFHCAESRDFQGISGGFPGDFRFWRKDNCGFCCDFAYVTYELDFPGFRSSAAWITLDPGVLKPDPGALDTGQVSEKSATEDGCQGKPAPVDEELGWL